MRTSAPGRSWSDTLFQLSIRRLALSDGYLEFSFDGYRLHSNGQLTDPVVDLHPFGGQAYRRTLLDEWIEIRPLQETCA